MSQEIISAFILIFIAEMGDKTQILAMAFATQYPIKKVLVGIGLGAFLNHGLAVLLGSYLSYFMPINTIQMISGVAFVCFALWTLKAEEDEENEETQVKFGPIVTVSLAFFIGELGDKTQLTAITLAADAVYPYMILVGTVTGMIATGALGIVVGKKMGDKIPELGIKLFAATVFMFFGLQKLFQTLPANFLQAVYIVPFISILTAIVFLMIRKLLHIRKLGIQSEFVTKSKLIHDYNNHIESDLNNICLGLEYCKVCLGSGCPIGHAKNVLNNTKFNQNSEDITTKTNNDYANKPFKEEEVIDSLVDTLMIINTVEDEKSLIHAHILRRQLEYILFRKFCKPEEDLQEYFNKLKSLDNTTANKIIKTYHMRKPIEDRVINLGSDHINTFLIEVQEGYLLIDTGYEDQYKKFVDKLTEEHIQLDEIAYIFITHSHDHHVGFLNQLLKKTKAQVILHPVAVDRLKAGADTAPQNYSSIFSKYYYQWLKLINKGRNNFQPVNNPERYILISDNNIEDIEAKLEAKIIPLPGHSKDSIGILFNKTALFCGDALMNRVTSRNHISMRIEDFNDYKATWKKILDMNYDKIYPSHGKPFKKEQLLKYAEKLDQIQLYAHSNK